MGNLDSFTKSEVELELLNKVILQMCMGDVISFSNAGSLLENLSFLELSKSLDQETMFALFIAKGFIHNVLSNLAGDSLFNFPNDGSQMEYHYKSMVINTGKFLQEIILKKDCDLLQATNFCVNAISIYYNYLQSLSELGKTSDLREIS